MTRCLDLRGLLFFFAGGAATVATLRLVRDDPASPIAVYATERVALVDTPAPLPPPPTAEASALSELSASLEEADRERRGETLRRLAEPLAMRHVRAALAAIAGVSARNSK